jgi:hypothetical protein
MNNSDSWDYAASIFRVEEYRLRNQLRYAGWL